ncbi:hypothetical protein [Chryseobacterium sp. OV279]|uniref:hypothetical protein n=1 Tax=Chryseobacterium sp. OV279 TaxID=1500285 RepID=UPI00092135D5|nr:hypothetical protein [Chryseobacterium sp. OV279]SHF44629.1 hypothetical protein SAMN02787100_2017 [Chryseobacterium sp. OV279]
MKKIKIYSTILLFVINGIAYSQIGISTANPQGIFHVDGAKDNHPVEQPSAIEQMNDVVVTADGQVGVGTTVPDISALMEIKSEKRGFLPPRTILVDKNDGVTIPNPATGLTVFHTGNVNMESGLYSNIGTPISPIWNKDGQTIINENQGSITYKSPIRPITDRSILNAGDFEFQVVRKSSGDPRSEYIHIRYTGTGTRNYSVFDIEGWTSSGYYSNPGNGTADNFFRQIAGSTNIGSINELNVIRIYDGVTKKVYRYEVNLIEVGGITYISQLIEVF